MFRIAVLVSGGGTNLQSIIDEIENGGLEGISIAAVISSNPNAFALKRAEKHGIKAIAVEKSDKRTFEERLANILIEEKVQLVVLAGFMTILSENFIRLFENKIINVHPSLIPAFCGTGFYGLKVHEEALKRGVKISGATVHFVNAIPDGGPIITQRSVEVLDGDTPETLQRRVMEQAEWKLLPEAISLIARNELEIAGGIVRRRAR